ncbi:MAG: hypothetical protein IJW43_00545 [Clostridia bacterium]|nr:hypothetical protein [Clostridia bacterium]
MKRNFYTIGIGGFGIKLAEETSRKMRDGKSSVISLAIDTDHFEIKDADCNHIVDMSYPDKLGSILDCLNEKGIRIFSEEEISDLGYVLTLPMDKGANLWRIKAMVSFIAYMSDRENKEKFDKILDEIALELDTEHVFYVMSSLAGGTGSALTLPITLYIKKYLREKGLEKTKFIYFSACPDVFVEGMNAELKSKSYANAYASLLELNTVNTVALRRGKSSFNIGFDEEKAFGVLFDGENPECHSKKYLPFEKVVMFDRMPGIFSTDFHLNLLADYVNFYSQGLTAKEEKEKFNSQGIFKSYSVAELDYSVDNIIDYIAKYRVNNSLKKEWLKFYNEVENYQTTKSLSPKSKVASSEIEEYANKIQSFFETLDIGRGEKTAYALDRLDAVELESTIDDESWLDKYLIDLSNGIIEKLQDESYLDLSQKFKYNEENKKEKISLADFSEKVDSLYIDLTNFYLETLQKTYSFDDESLFLSTEKDLFSLITHALKDGNEFIHPTLALVRLTSLYVKLVKRAKRYCSLTEEELEKSQKENKLPEKLLLLSAPIRGHKGYGSLKEDRFKRIVAKIEKKVDVKSLKFFEKRAYLKDKKRYALKNPSVDEKFVLADFNSILEEIVLNFRGLYVKKLISLVETLINSYKKMIKDVSLYSYQFGCEVEAAEKERISQGVYYGVNTSKKDRENAVKEYFAEARLGGFNYEDNFMGKLAFEYSLEQSKKPYTDSLKPIESFINSLVNETLTKIKASDYYAKISTKNVFSAVIEPFDKKPEKNYLKTALMLKDNFLTENPQEQSQRKTLFVSPKIAEYILEHKKELFVRATESKDALDEFIVNLGEYETEIEFVDGLSDRKAYVVSEKNGITFESISKANGEKFVSVYKNEYEKSIDNIEKYSTQMWNPHLFDLRNGIDLIRL